MCAVLVKARTGLQAQRERQSGAMRAEPPVAPDAPLHLLIDGRVQGVGFRESMVFEATRLAVRGWVRNRLDGSVEAVFDGAPPARAALLAWARRGPGVALVTSVQVRAANAGEIASIGSSFTRMPTAR